MSADATTLYAWAGPQAARAILAAQGLLTHTLRRRVEERPLIENAQDLIDYLHLRCAAAPVERCCVLYLTARHRLILEQSHDGTIDESPVYVREIIRKALDIGACGVLLAHNHPSGDPTPSGDDCIRTRDLIAAARLFDIQVVDHLIIARSECRSMRAMGYLE
jgi:DNA repair protein RadC